MQAWAQNLGHDSLTTTFGSYGKVSAEEQGTSRASVSPHDPCMRLRECFLTPHARHLTFGAWSQSLCVRFFGLRCLQALYQIKYHALKARSVNPVEGEPRKLLAENQRDRRWQRVAPLIIVPARVLDPNPLGELWPAELS
jgi:hypothetical protein